MTEQSQEGKNEIITTDNELEDKLNEIEKMSNEYALLGEYDKAKECKKQIVVLQAKLKERKKQDLEQQHIYEMENLEQAYQQEIEPVKRPTGKDVSEATEILRRKRDKEKEGTAKEN